MADFPILRIKNWDKYKLSRQSVLKHRKNSLLWIPVYVDSWLMGSIHFELKPDEQATFLDFLLLAAKDNGFIRANEATPYTVKFLSGMLNKSEDLIQRTVQKCLSSSISKLQICKGGLQNCQGDCQNCQGDSKKPIPREEKKREEKRREEYIGGSDKSDPRSQSAGRLARIFWDEHKSILRESPKEAFQEIRGKFKHLLGDRDGKEILPRYSEEKLKTWILLFLKSTDPRIAELGGHTVGVMGDWIARNMAKGK